MTDLGTGRSSPHHQSPAAALGVIPFAERQTGQATRRNATHPWSWGPESLSASTSCQSPEPGIFTLCRPGWTGWTLTSPPPLLLLLPLPLPHPEPLPPIPFYHSYSHSRPHSITSLDLTWPDLARLDSTCPALSCLAVWSCFESHNSALFLCLLFSILLLLHANTADTPDKPTWTSRIVCRSMRSMSPEQTHPPEVLQRLDLFPDTWAAKPKSNPQAHPLVQAGKQSPLSSPTDLTVASPASTRSRPALG